MNTKPLPEGEIDADVLRAFREKIIRELRQSDARAAKDAYTQLLHFTNSNVALMMCAQHPPTVAVARRLNAVIYGHRVLLIGCIVSVVLVIVIDWKYIWISLIAALGVWALSEIQTRLNVELGAHVYALFSRFEKAAAEYAQATKREQS